MIDEKTMSIRWSFFLTTIAEAIEEAKMNKNGIGWNDVIKKTPRDIKIEK